jgi:predicted RNA-binding Zn ribbon-like protein
MTTDETFLLDLLNSTPVVDGTQQDVLDTTWLRAHGGTGSSTERESTRAARNVLQDLVRGQAPVTALAPLLAGVSRRPSVTTHGLEWTVEVSAARRQAVRAVLAWDTVWRAKPGRLRPCENSECALFLLDQSKPNKARWCSMAVCGNRMKARRHYERARRNA